MDLQMRVQKKSHIAVLKARQRNEIARRILDENLHMLRSRYLKSATDFHKQTKIVKTELDDLFRYQRDLSGDVSYFPRASSTTSAPSRLERNTDSIRISSTCKFGACSQTHPCKYFPCSLPTTYKSLGDRVIPISYSVLSNYRKLLESSQWKGKRILSANIREQQKLNERSNQRVYNAPRTTIRDRERGLKQLIIEMKERNDEKKPHPWATNYGTPMPRRQIIKTVLPVEESSVA